MGFSVPSEYNSKVRLRDRQSGQIRFDSNQYQDRGDLYIYMSVEDIDQPWSDWNAFPFTSNETRDNL